MQPQGINFIAWPDPLRDTYKLAEKEIPLQRLARIENIEKLLDALEAQTGPKHRFQAPRK